MIRKLKEFNPEGLKEFNPNIYWKKVNQFSSMMLAEAYIRNDSIDWLEVFEKLKGWINHKIDDKSFWSFLNTKGIDLKSIKDDNIVIGGYFDVNTRKIVIVFSDKILSKILTGDKNTLKIIADNFWVKKL